MARVTNPTFVAAAKPESKGASLIPLEQIPDEIKTEVEEMYAVLATAKGRFTVEFTTKEEANEYAQQVNSYCEQRPAGKIRFRRSPIAGSKGNPNQVIFRITDPLPEKTEGETSAESETPKRKPGRPRKTAA